MFMFFFTRIYGDYTGLVDVEDAGEEAVGAVGGYGAEVEFSGE